MSREIPGATTSQRRRLKLITAAVVAVLCLIWFVPWAYVRITTPPARTHDDVSDLVDRLYTPRDDDATDEWLTALAGWPPWQAWATFNEPPPRGMKWEFGSDGPSSPDLDDMNAGNWNSAERPTLRFLIRRISSPQMTTFLKSVTNLRERSWIWQSGLGQAPPGIEFSQARGISRLLVARSRYRQAELKDIQGAWDDLKTVFTLSRTAIRNLLIHTLVLSACEDLAIGELRHFLREVTIDEKILDDMLETLSALPNFEQIWRTAMESQHQDDLDEIARRFTDDGNGNGWLVLGMQPDTESLQWSDWPKPAADRSGLWNLLSFLYHDRKTVEARVHRHWSQRLAAGLQPYAAAVRALAELDPQPLFVPADGPWLHAVERHGRVETRIILQGQVRAIANRRAAQIMVALRRFRGERGHYPARLDDLAPRFIGSLPVDPFCDDSFAYQRAGDDDYVLYSCGYDGVDDGGRARERGAAGRWDFVYTKPRNDPHTKEPVAVPLDAEDPDSESSDWSKP